MTYLYKPFATVIMLCILLAGKAQDAPIEKKLDNQVHLSKNLNGMNVLAQVNSNYNNVEVILYVKTGPVYENDSFSGISYITQSLLAEKLATYLRKGKPGLSFQNTSLSSYITTELSIFQLTTSPVSYPQALQLLHDSVLATQIYESDLKQTLETVRKEISDGKSNYKSIYETKMLTKLFRKDAGRQILVGDTSGLYKRIDIDQVKRYYTRYYVPNNCIINGYGNFNLFQFQDRVTATFKDLVKSKFDPETIVKIIDFKGMVYSTQYTVNAPVEQPQIEIIWQFPGTRSNVKSSYHAFLLSAMLNDPNNYIQVKARKLGCRKLTATYDARNFSGIFKISMLPDKNRLYETYQMVLKEMQRIDETLVNESMMKVGMLNFQKEYNNIKASKDYIQWLTKYYVYNDETYFPALKDSVFLLGERRMRKFVIEYIKQSPHITALMINESDRVILKIDSLMPELDIDVNNYIFTYRPNIADLEGPENLHKLNNLLQWLTINPDMVVQVNGFADKGEFGKAKDDSIKLFIDSIPTFKKVREEWIKTGSIRIEMMRAMKIIKYLSDHGIEMERLKGTSMPFSSKNKEEELANMKCTLTIEKIRKSPSVYEYHYGKKKENEQHE